MAEKRFVYADNAASSPLSPKALEAMLPYLQSNYANASQPYSFARVARKALSQSRKIIAECINASPEEIYFTSGGSESNNWVINGAIDFAIDIVTSAIEHHSILRPAQYAAEKGCNLAYIPVSETGLIELHELYSRIQNPGSLISIMLANNEIGTIQHIADLAQLSHDAKCIFHTDAVQALGHVKVDVQTLGIDLLSGSAHKFNGPKGIGFLYVRKGMRWPALIKGGSQEFGFRSGTENIAAIVGMATALEENVSSIENNASILNEIECKFLCELTTRGIKFHKNGDSSHIPGNISLSFNSYEGEMLLHRLDLKGVMVSTGSACDSKETQISHVLKAIGLSEETAKGTIRISFGHQNSIADAIYIAEAIASIVTPSYSKVKNTDYRSNESCSNISLIGKQIDSVKESVPAYPSVSIRPNHDLAYYIKEFGRLRGKIHTKGGILSPHKPVLLLSIFELIKTDIITSNRVYFDDILIAKFCEIWNKVVPSNLCHHPNYSEPFVRLSSSPFYKLKLKHPIDVKIKTWNSKRVKQYVEYAVLDTELVELIRNGCTEIEDYLLAQIN